MVAQQRKERARDARLEMQRRRHLHKKWAQTPTQAGDTGEKFLQRAAGGPQPFIVGDALWHFHREFEVARRLLRPARVAPGAMGPVER